MCEWISEAVGKCEIDRYVVKESDEFINAMGCCRVQRGIIQETKKTVYDVHINSMAVNLHIAIADNCENFDKISKLFKSESRAFQDKLIGYAIKLLKPRNVIKIIEAHQESSYNDGKKSKIGELKGVLEL